MGLPGQGAGTGAAPQVIACYGRCRLCGSSHRGGTSQRGGDRRHALVGAAQDVPQVLMLQLFQQLELCWLWGLGVWTSNRRIDLTTTL